MSDEPRMTGMDKEIFNATRTLTSLLNDACNHWNYLCPYLERLAGVANDALRGYQKDYPEQVAELIDHRRERESVGNPDTLGNAAEMREAFNNIGNACAWVAENCNDQQTAKYMNDIIAMVQAALSAPARNCDLFDNWYDAHQAWERLPKDELGYFVAANGVHKCEQAWLFTPAAERKRRM